MKIPKKIMQTWKTKQVPEQWLESPHQIKIWHPDWEYTLMSDLDNLAFVEKHFPEYLEMYLGFEHNIQRADVIRYMWLYIEGGVYLDLDLIPNYNFETILEDKKDIILIRGALGNKQLTNFFMASRPGHPFWLYLLSEIKRISQEGTWWNHLNYLQVLMTTGPWVVDQTAKKYQVDYSDLSEHTVLDRTVCQIEQSEFCRYQELPEVPLFNQARGSSWVNNTVTNVWTSMYCVWWLKWIWLLVIIVIILRLILVFKNNNADCYYCRLRLQQNRQENIINHHRYLQVC